MKVVTRFAVSPTGFMHIGGIRTALFAYLWAKKNQGTFILRIEDTDKAREVEGATEHIMKALHWLDLDWDLGPQKEGPHGSYIQSERLDIYRDYAKRLIEKGFAYPDPYTPEEVAAFRADAEAKKEPFLFRNHRPETFMEWDGTQTLRLRVPEIKRYHWQDAVRGDLEAGEEMLDDIVLMKADGFPTYNFCHIVDDIEMGVTHVLRGDEFISSQPKFLSIYDALGEPYPIFVSLPPIMNAAGNKKLSKRDGAKDLFTYQEEGFLPEVMVNFLALVGWNPGSDQEIFSREELVTAFDLSGIQKSGGAFNEDKLRWMNKEYLDQLSTEDYVAYLGDIVTDIKHNQDRFLRLLPTIRERAHTRAEVAADVTVGEYNWVLHDEITYETELLKWKQDDTVSDAVPRLQKAAELLQEADFTSPDTIKTAVWGYAEEVGKGQVLWPLRVALSGKERSPDPFTCAYTLGQAESLKRISQACDKIEGNVQA